MKLMEVKPVAEETAKKIKLSRDAEDKDEEFVSMSLPTPHLSSASHISFCSPVFMWAALATCLSGIEDITDPTTLRLVYERII